uniref:actin-related protein 10-like n=1 Tax=Styela clava TaxID=7725 RepID=UPI0019398B39|nr:actin-related protein 10-like [Styela clava]
MPLYQTLFAVVLDIGQAYTKVGFAGESSPRAIIPTSLKTEGIGEEPLIPGIAENSEINKLHLGTKLKAFLHHIYFKYLQISPKDRRVIVCESLLNPTIFREIIADVLFTNFEVPSVLFAPHHLLSCFTVAADTALVLDCSEYESSALPVIEGTPVIWAWHAAPLASNAIHRQIHTMIQAGGLIQKENGKPVKLTEDIPHNVIEDIKVKSCFVAGYERAKQIQAHRLAQWTAAASQEGEGAATTEKRPSPPPDMVYPMGGRKLLMIPGIVREEAAEVLFEQDNDRLSVATIVLDSILKCPLDSRKELAKNLIVSGGTSMLPGFLHRLLSELRDLVAEEDRYQQLSECEFRVHKTPVHPNLVSWLGASVYACLDTFPIKSVTKDYFTQHKKRLPDWCVLDLQPPEQLPERPSSLLSGIKGLSRTSKIGATSMTSLKTSTRTSTSSASAALASLRLSKSDTKLSSAETKK